MGRKKVESVLERHVNESGVIRQYQLQSYFIVVLAYESAL